MGELLRSKGFIWLATSNKYIGGWQQAGNIQRGEVAGLWLEGESDTATNANSFDDRNNGGSGLFSVNERKRQELVFIGMNLKIQAIHAALDKCLLKDEELKMTPDHWNNYMDAENKLKSALPLPLLFPDEDVIDIDINKIIEDITKS